MSTRNSNYHRRGTAVIWVAICGTAFIALLGLAMDTARVNYVNLQLQATADAAALAGAQLVQIDVEEARELAATIGFANIAGNESIAFQPNVANEISGDIVVGRWDRENHTFDPLSDRPNAVKAVARRASGSENPPLDLLFGGISDITDIDLAQDAIAMVGGTTGAGMIALDPYSSCTLDIRGDDVLILEAAEGYDGDAAIHVDSNDPCGLCTSGSSLEIHAPDTNVVGAACIAGNPTLDTNLNPGSSYVPDPLLGVPPPSYGPSDLGSITTGGTYPEGYYSGGIRITSASDTVVLEPGIYALDGEGLYVNGGNLIAHEVMFYIMGDGRVYLGGNGQIEISPISNIESPYWGISIFQARENKNESTIIGNSDMILEGTYYFPSAHLEIGGTGIALGNQLIAWQIYIHGTGTFNIAYDGRFPARGNKVFLVE